MSGCCTILNKSPWCSAWLCSLKPHCRTFCLISRFIYNVYIGEKNLTCSTLLWVGQPHLTSESNLCWERDITSHRLIHCKNSLFSVEPVIGSTFERPSADMKMDGPQFCDSLATSLTYKPHRYSHSVFISWINSVVALANNYQVVYLTSFYLTLCMNNIFFSSKIINLEWFAVWLLSWKWN